MFYYQYQMSKSLEVYLDIIADYGGKRGVNDLAFSEVKNKLLYYFTMHGMRCNILSCLSVHAFNTIETGFAVGQIANNSMLSNHIVFHNTAPRLDDLSSRKDNDGEKLASAITPNGTLIIGVHSMECFSFLNHSGIYYVNCENKGSQFRSRDIFPEATAKLAMDIFLNHNTIETSDYNHCIAPNSIVIQDNLVLYIDGYGNIKTNIAERFLSMSKIGITINKRKHIVKCNNGMFDIEHGNITIAKGSSTYYSNNAMNSVVEISVRGGSAYNAFDKPIPGDKILIETFE